MKRQLFLIRTMTIIGFVIVILNGCQKDDTTPPVIDLYGQPDIYLSLNHAPIFFPVSANDNKDGALPVSTTGTVDLNTEGAYTLTYSATDNSGNTGYATRIVYIANDADPWAGTYAVYDSSVTEVIDYSQIITTDIHINKRIHFNLFADYSSNINIYATSSVTGDTITIPSQRASNIGNANETHTFSGTGIKSGNNFTLIYIDINNSNGNSSSTSYTVYTRQ